MEGAAHQSHYKLAVHAINYNSMLRNQVAEVFHLRIANM